jgi:hypothetical protein
MYFGIHRFNWSGDEAECNTEYLKLSQLMVSTSPMVQPGFNGIMVVGDCFYTFRLQ